MRQKAEKKRENVYDYTWNRKKGSDLVTRERMRKRGGGGQKDRETDRLSKRDKEREVGRERGI